MIIDMLQQIHSHTHTLTLTENGRVGMVTEIGTSMCLYYVPHFQQGTSPFLVLCANCNCFKSFITHTSPLSLSLFSYVLSLNRFLSHRVASLSCSCCTHIDVYPRACSSNPLGHSPLVESCLICWQQS